MYKDNLDRESPVPEYLHPQWETEVAARNCIVGETRDTAMFKLDNFGQVKAVEVHYFQTLSGI